MTASEFETFETAEYVEDDGFMSLSDFGEIDESDGSDVAGIGEGLDEVAPIISEFLRSTPALTASEQAELIGAAMEKGAASSGSSGGTDFASIGRALQTGLSLFQTGAQIAGGLAGAFGGSNRTARDFRTWANRLGQGAGQINNLVGALRGRGVAAPTAPGAPRAMPTQPARLPTAAPPAPGGRVPMRPRAGARPMAGRGAPVNATAMLGLLLNNPALLQALRAAPVRGRAGAREVVLRLPSMESVAIPLGAVMNTISVLARESMSELNALTSEDDPEVPEYLLGESGEMLVDPSNSLERAGLVLEYFRVEGEARRYGELGVLGGDSGGARFEADESELWAREAGFTD